MAGNKAEQMRQSTVTQLSGQTRQLLDKCLYGPLNSWSQSEDLVPDGPSLMYIGINNICNYHCHVCAYRKAMRRERGNMSFELFEHIVEDLPPSVKRAYLMKQGEPLLHPELPRMLVHFKQRRPEVEMALHSNGSRLTPNLFGPILENVDFFSFSAFAISAEVYAKVHGRDLFDKAMANLDGFFRAWQAAERKPKVYIDYVSQKGNSTETDQQVFEFFEAKVPGWGIGIHDTFNFQEFGPEGSLDIYNRLDYGHFPCCVFPWMSMTVCWDGKVDYCFVEPAERFFLGDVNEQCLMDIWNNDEYRRFRRMWTQRDFDQMERSEIMCRKCGWLWSLPSQSVENLVLGSRPDIDIEALDREILMAVDADQAMQAGAKAFLAGKTGQAWQAFALAQTMAGSGEVARDAENWQDRCRKVIEANADRPRWEQMLGREGRSLRELNVTRYKEQG